MTIYAIILLRFFVDCVRHSLLYIFGNDYVLDRGVARISDWGGGLGANEARFIWGSGSLPPAKIKKLLFITTDFIV